jgi:hypothetical protein
MHNSSIPMTPQTDPRNFPQWDAKAPPGQSGHKYPKMLTRPFTVADRDEWLVKNRRIDRNTREEYYEERVPRIGIEYPVSATQEVVDAGFADRVGEAVIFRTEADEKAILQLLRNEEWLKDKTQGLSDPQKAVSVSSGDLATILDTPADKLEAENARLRALIAERDKLQAQLRADTEIFTEYPGMPGSIDAPIDAPDRPRKAKGAPKAKGWPKGKPRGKRAQVPSAAAAVAKAKANARANAARAMSAAQLAGDEG